MSSFENATDWRIDPTIVLPEDPVGFHAYNIPLPKAPALLEHLEYITTQHISAEIPYHLASYSIVNSMAVKHDKNPLL